jgi:hypothetical protein
LEFPRIGEAIPDRRSQASGFRRSGHSPRKVYSLPRLSTKR